LPQLSTISPRLNFWLESSPTSIGESNFGGKMTSWLHFILKIQFFTWKRKFYFTFEYHYRVISMSISFLKSNRYMKFSAALCVIYCHFSAMKI
jgi:hypothetical protein